MKKCPKCGSVNIVEREPKDGRKRWICKCCEHKMIEKIKVKSNANYILRDDPEPQNGVSDYEMMFPKISDDFQGLITSLKNSLSGVQPILVCFCVTAFVIISIISYNIGKKSAIDKAWLMQKSDYQTIINEYAVAKNELPKLKKEITSNSDFVEELNDYKKNKDEKLSEISKLKNQISDLKNDKQDLEKDIAKLSNEIDALSDEKEKLTGEIAKAKGKGYTLTAGKYIGGDDIPTGTYNINWVSGHGNVFVGHEVNEMFGTDSKYYIKSYKNCEVSYGTEIEIKGTLKVQFKAKD